MDKRKRQLTTAIATLVAVAIIGSLASRTARYRRVIYYQQRLSEENNTLDKQYCTEQIEHIVGRPHTSVDKLPTIPLYPHFWDTYNQYGITIK